MIIVVQRVSKASVVIEEKIKGEITSGLMVLLGITTDDSADDVEWLANKMVNLRIFNDDEGVMNKSLVDVSGDVLLISQFTLHASTKKGNRPSYTKAANPTIALPLYEAYIAKTEQLLGKPIATGQFGADMKVSLTNDGPVTIIIDSKERK